MRPNRVKRGCVGLGTALIVVTISPKSGVGQDPHAAAKGRRFAGSRLQSLA